MKGKWRIIEMPDYESDYPDMMEPAYILLDGTRRMPFSAAQPRRNNFSSFLDQRLQSLYLLKFAPPRSAQRKTRIEGTGGMPCNSQRNLQRYW